MMEVVVATGAVNRRAKFAKCKAYPKRTHIVGIKGEGKSERGGGNWLENG